MKIKLSHKVILVILVPLVIQLAFLALMTGAVNDFTERQNQVQKLTEVLLAGDRLEIDENLRILIYGLFRATKKPVYSERFEKNERDAKATYNLIGDYWRKQPAKMRSLRQASKTNDYIGSIAREQMLSDLPCKTISDVLGGPMGIYSVSIKIGLNKSLPNFNIEVGRAAQGSMAHILTADAAECEIAGKQVQDAFQETNMLAAAALILSAISSAGAWLFFSSSISNRLKLVMKNISTLGDQHTEPVSVGGSDEITALNNAIKDTSNALASAQAFQNQTTRIVVDDLDLPLRRTGNLLMQLRQQGIDDITEKGVQRLTNSTQEIERLQKLVDDLTQLETLQMKGYNLILESVDLAEIANSATSILIEFAASKSIKLVVEERSKAVVQGDPDRLIQVAINLVSNSIKFSPADSTIQVVVEQLQGTGRLTVKDTGSGITEEFRSKIFQRFEQSGTQASEKKGGSGLGLSLSKDLIEAQGGKMDFRSESGHGAEFWFELPTTNDNRVEDSASSNFKSDRLKSSLWRRGVVLVALPFLVQVVTVLALLGVLGAEKANIDEFNRANTFASTYAEMVNEVSLGTLAALMYNVTQDKRCKTSSKEENAKVEKRLEKLEKIASTPELKSSYNELKQVMQNQQAIQNEVMDAEKNAPLDAWLGVGHTGRLEDLLMYAAVPLQSALEHEQAIIEKKKLASTEVQQRLELTLALSAVLAALISAWSGLYIANGISRKLNDLLRKTEEFLEVKQLSVPSAGNDEFAYLEHNFHDAAKKLLELEEFRREMTAVTSHELRTPLTSLSALTDLVENGVFGAVNEQGSKALHLAQANIADLIAMITNLLDVEKMQSGKLLIRKSEADIDEILQVVEKKSMQLAHEKEIELKFIPTGLLVQADTNRLIQALSAALSSLIDFMPYESRIELTSSSSGGETCLSLAATAGSQRQGWGNRGGRQRLARDLCKLVADQHGGSLSMSHAGKERIVIHLPDIADC